MCNIWLAAFTARTTRVSNPDRSPSFRPSPSDPFQKGAFATGSPRRIIGFNPYPTSTPFLSRSLALQYSQHARQFTVGFHQELTEPATDALDPVKAAITWTPSITAAAGTRVTQSLFNHLFSVVKSHRKNDGTPTCLVALTRIAKFSRLLRSVEPGLMSQSPS